MYEILIDLKIQCHFGHVNIHEHATHGVHANCVGTEEVGRRKYVIKTHGQV